LAVTAEVAGAAGDEFRNLADEGRVGATVEVVGLAAVGVGGNNVALAPEEGL
jgi:hypothetical protein